MTYLSQAHLWLSEAQNLRKRAAFFDVLWHLRNVLSIKEELAIQTPCAEWFYRLVEKWHAERAFLGLMGFLLQRYPDLRCAWLTEKLQKIH